MEKWRGEKIRKGKEKRGNEVRGNIVYRWKGTGWKYEVIQKGKGDGDELLINRRWRR